MASQFGKDLARDLKAVGLLPVNRYSLRRLFAVVLALFPPIVFAWFAESSGRWELFERSGSITAAIGLLLASRRYLQHGVIELVMMNANDKLKSNIEESLEDVITGKLGLALSAFGTIIWGWGTYLGWWCFTSLAVWAIVALRNMRRDANARLAGR